MSKYIGGVHKILRESVEGLATSSDTIQNRIYNIFISHLTSLFGEFKNQSLDILLNQMNKKNKEKSLLTLEEIETTLQDNKGGKELDNETAELVAKSILSLYQFIISPLFNKRGYKFF